MSPSSSGEEKEEEEEEKEEEEKEEEYEVEDDSTDRGVIKKEDCSNEASSKTKNIQKLLLLHLQKDN